MERGRAYIEEDDIRFVIDWGKRDLHGEGGEAVRGRCYDVCVISFILLIIMSPSLCASCCCSSLTFPLSLSLLLFNFLKACF